MKAFNKMKKPKHWTKIKKWKIKIIPFEDIKYFTYFYRKRYVKKISMPYNKNKDFFVSKAFNVTETSFELSRIQNYKFRIFENKKTISK